MTRCEGGACASPRGKLWIELEDGRELGCPLTTFPRLASAKPKDLETWEWIGGGTGIHWPALDEDLSVAGLMRGTPPAQAMPEKLAHRGAFLAAARRASSLTQADLAARLGKSQTLVSLTERGRVWTGEAYRLEVLKACGLPALWRPKQTQTHKKT
ncbi:MAG: DUF2442 domain-containing protein [Holophagaceae bacterium]|nr:DUF2442 domain-containing protein [Holophagaceae bacterium]